MGGCRWAGKSHGARLACIAWAVAVPGISVYLFRREYKDLYLNHLTGATGFRALLQPLFERGRVIFRESEIEFVKEGSKIHLCHCQYEKDVYGYQGAEMSVMILEEATQFTEFQIRYLRSRVRMPDAIKIPAHLKGMFPRIVYPTNPGGVGHSYLKTAFVDKAKELACGRALDEVQWTAPDDDGGFVRQFIPARLEDNPAVNPDEYRKRLLGLSSPQHVKALLDGDWNAVVGAHFPEASSIHVIPDIEIPSYLFHMRVFDWGSTAPFSCLWIAVADGKFHDIPSGSLIVYREWYGSISSDHRKGLQLSNEQVARGIKERTPASELIQLTISDGKPFQATGGLTIAQEFEKFGVPLTQGDVSPGSRHQGWQQMRSRLIGFDSVPRLYFTSNCPLVFQHLCQIQTDDKKPEDIDTEGIDHDLDALSLACKARPMVRTTEPDIDKGPLQPNQFTFDAIFKKHQRKKAAANHGW